jgi:AraC-like DNA-binding protein
LCASLDGLLDRAKAIRLLHHSITRELPYWLLASRRGRPLRGLGRPGGAAQRIARAVAVLRGEFDRSFRLERLAAVAGMSVPSFHQHFRAVTSLSPMQLQKQ